MGKLVMDAEYANAQMRHVIASQISLVKDFLPLLTKRPDGSYEDFKIGDDVIISRHAIDVYLEVNKQQAGDKWLSYVPIRKGSVTYYTLSKSLEQAIVEYIKRTKSKKFRSRVVCTT